MKKIAVLALALTLTACASSGVKVSQHQVSQFKQGTTTKQDVYASLGSPTSEVFNGDGSSMIMYTHAEAKTRASTFIPIVGLFTGGVDTRTTNVVMYFDKNNILTSSASSNSALGTATGISAGNIESVQQQPR